MNKLTAIAPNRPNVVLRSGLHQCTCHYMSKRFVSRVPRSEIPGMCPWTHQSNQGQAHNFTGGIEMFQGSFNSDLRVVDSSDCRTNSAKREDWLVEPSMNADLRLVKVKEATSQQWFSKGQHIMIFRGLTCNRSLVLGSVTANPDKHVS